MTKKKESGPLVLGQLFPNFEANTTEGKMRFYDWMGNSWAIIFSHPADFTPVCTTELTRMAQLATKFEDRGVKIIGLSCDTIDSHKAWIKDLQSFGKLSGPFPYPIIDDHHKVLAVKLGMINAADQDRPYTLPCRAVCNNSITAHYDPKHCLAQSRKGSAVKTTGYLFTVYIIGKDKRLKASILYPASTGRNFDEILRIIDALQLTERSGFTVATPVDWKPGTECMVEPHVPEEELGRKFPKGVKKVEVPSGKEYLKFTPSP